MHGNLSANLLGGLKAKVVDVFAVMPSSDAPRKAQAGMNFDPVDNDEALLQSALSTIRPRAIRRIKHVDVKTNKACKVSGSFGTHDPERLFAQPSHWRACFDMVQRAEREDGALYDYVVRARPDGWWFAQHPPLCGADKQSRPAVHIHTIHGKRDCIRSAGHGQPPPLDQHFVLPRAAAAAVMSGMATSYEHCVGWLRANNRTVNNLETWMYYTLRELRSLPIVCHVFPFVIVRKDSGQPSAAMMCAHNYPGAWDPINDTRVETPERRACYRGAYPNEAWKWPESEDLASSGRLQ